MASNGLANPEPLTLKRTLDEEQLTNGDASVLPLKPTPMNPATQSNGARGEYIEEPSAKRMKLEEPGITPAKVDARDKIKGIALVKPEYLVHTFKRNNETANKGADNDDAAEAGLRANDRENGGNPNGKKKKREKGQNKERQFGSSHDFIRLCNTLQYSPEFSPEECSYGDKCRCSHDLRKYLTSGKRPDLETWNGLCPVWEKYGICHDGWKCRFVGSHSKEVEREDGRKELVLITKETAIPRDDKDDSRPGVSNIVATKDKLALAKRKMDSSRADEYISWMDKDSLEMEKKYHNRGGAHDSREGREGDDDGVQGDDIVKHDNEAKEDNRAQFTDPPFLPSEKRRIYFGAETPVLAPLTTQGNMPYRRLCIDFGAQLTYSEMAMSVPLVQGQKSEWTLLKAHESELSSPNFTPTSVVKEYDNTKDLRFGAQISASKPWQAFKAVDAMSKLTPHLRVIDLNCGCPIEMVYRTGAGSGLLDAPSKLEKMIRGMNTLSGEIPITAKIRTGTRDGKENATKIIERLAFGGHESKRLGAPGCAALTLHGRTRQQRYTKNADWSYIAECATLIKSYNQKKDDLTDTVREPDERTQANGGKLYFIGNGDCYSHVDYLDHIQKAGVDSVMVARGALIKPWLFEEIDKGQYIDKSSSQRLEYIEKFVKYGLEAWGSDEPGIGLTRRFLLEWLSFAHRYVPIGILDHLPPSLQDRPPAYRGRDDLETLMASDNYQDWMKISEMFLGPAHKDFKFQPKHKSNSYEDAEG